MSGIFSDSELDPFVPEDVKLVFPPSVMEKVNKMKAKTDLVVQLFDLPVSEKVVQDYRCSMRGEVEASGKIYITQNYLLFVSKDQTILEALPFYRVTGIEQQKVGLLSTGIIVHCDSDMMTFSGFMHRQEAYNLLRHLWTFQPTYVQLSESDLISQIKEEVKDVELDMPKAPVGKQTTQGEFNGRWGELSQNIQDMVEHEVPDLSIGEKSRQKALAIREQNTATLARMQEQAESLDRTERNIKETDNHYKQAGRQLDGLESTLGQVKNTFTPNLHKNKLSAYEAINREVSTAREKYTDIPILIKQPNDFLEPGLLRFGERTFRCLNGEREELKRFTYTYDQVTRISVRARHQHLDLHFRHSSERFRCCTSFLQAVVNELFLRTKPNQLILVHEPETRRFQYGSLSIRELTLRGTRGEDGGGETYSDDQGFQLAPKANYSAMLGEHTPGGVVEAQQVQDSQIDSLSAIVQDIRSIDDATRKEMDRQSSQLDSIHDRTDDTLHRAHHADYRASRLK